jgi:indoleamine 2,3-dioxygenase
MLAHAWAADVGFLLLMWAAPRVRLPMSGWRSNPALPQGLLYEGVWPAPVQLYGETGAQSSILHALDAALGVQHTCGW